MPAEDRHPDVAGSFYEKPLHWRRRLTDRGKQVFVFRMLDCAGDLAASAAHALFRFHEYLVHIVLLCRKTEAFATLGHG
jgi:hypothetical protein